MKTNIVIFEMNPEVLDVFRVPETAVSAEVLNALAGLYFNCDDVTDEDWSNFDVVNVAVSEEMRASNGVEKLDFPFQPLPGLTVEELLKPFQDFWSSLPETLSIRRFPFFPVCDLAESYCFGLIHDEADCDPVHEVDSPDDDPKSCYHC